MQGGDALALSHQGHVSLFVVSWDAAARFCQNQDLWDYRILRILPARAFSFGRRLSVFGLAGFSIMAKNAISAKRNPENPVNPINPDSAQGAQSPRTRALVAAAVAPRFQFAPVVGHGDRQGAAPRHMRRSACYRICRAGWGARFGACRPITRFATGSPALATGFRARMPPAMTGAPLSTGKTASPVQAESYRGLGWLSPT